MPCRRPKRSTPAAGPTPGGPTGASPGPAAGDPAIVANGWLLLRWPEFQQRWDVLVAEVEGLHRRDPSGYREHKTTRFLALLLRLVMHEIPRDPGDPRYRQGKTLGSKYTHWRRAKFGGRFRLFFRYHTEGRMIAYVWLNDEATLRKAGARTDVYAVFKAKLEQDKPPMDWDDLVRACTVWRASEAGVPSPIRGP